jgi:purine-nucleoside phosphorylase
MLKKIKQTTEFINNEVDNFKPQVGIILGTGLGGLVKEIKIKYTLSYKSIPNFPVSTVKGHQGKLIFGILGGKNVVAMQGRFHYYEGYSMQKLSFPIRVMKYLGIELLIVSNASGGVNSDFSIGDIMIIEDHINLMPTNPLIGENFYELGPRFPDMSEAYDKNIIEKAIKIANAHNFKYQKGVYAALTGPCFETPSEYSRIKNIGADAVGMSTVPEVITARHMNIPCFAISIITDLGIKGKIVQVSHKEVIEAASNAEPKITIIIKELIACL